MKNIIKIFIKDLKSICTNFFPLLICGALVIIASCYAVFNIFSNWDPYGNTDNLTILVYNNDKGYTAEDGTEYNQGDSIIENLKENKSIDWKVADTKNALIEAVTNGDVYAGIVIDEDFSKDMLDFLSADSGFQKPEITYYDNGKKNAVAVKVTDTAVETLQSTINKTFLETVVKTVMEQVSNIVNESGEENAADLIISKLTSINDNLVQYDQIITDFTSENQEMHGKLDIAQRELENVQGDINNGISDVQSIQGGLTDTKTSYQQFSATMNSLLGDMENSLATVASDVQNSRLLTSDIDQLNSILNKTLTDVSGLYDTAMNVGKNYSSETIKTFITAIQTLNSSLITVQQVNIQAPDLSTLDQALGNCASQISSLQDTYNNVVTPEINGVLDNMNMVLENVTITMQTLNNLTGNAGTLFSNIDTTITYTDESLAQVQTVIREISSKLQNVLEEVQTASDSEKMQILVSFLTGDADSYGKYFSEIIQVDTNVVFPVDNYGSACSVFYVVLALYVLALILTSELKVEADTTELTDVKPYQTYFGRYLTFWLLGFIQSLLLSAFLIFVMKIQCQHVITFFVVNAIISFVFTNITYSCVKTFGLIYGRTLATILVIFQMSTGGCTYSVEQIPSSMRWLSAYMPFTYCSNALREVCFGYTNYDLSIYLGKLMIFVAVSLFFGLVVRGPIYNLMVFIDTRLQETGIMGVKEEEEDEEEEEYDDEGEEEEEYDDEGEEEDEYDDDDGEYIDVEEREGGDRNE